MSWFSRIFGEGKAAAVPAANMSEPASRPDGLPELTPLQAMAMEQATTFMHQVNESLQLANNSTNPETKVSRLEFARSKLTDLELFAQRHPFIKLQRLEGVQRTIAQLAEEFSEAGYYAQTDVSEYTESNDHNRQRLSRSDEQAILMGIQSQFKVINESIEIARKSKNLDTKISRLGVARNTLKRAREQAAQFSLAVDGFEQAETAINRIQEALESGAPQKILDTMEIPIDMSMSSIARDLLKEATALKREKKYADACEKLREAYSSDGAEDLMIEERLRLPMYLLLAGRNDEGWEELNRLNARYIDQFSQPLIANQMRVFRSKEGKNRPAAPLLERDENYRDCTQTVGESINFPIDDIAKGWEFSATIQLRTPLRVLSRHGEIHQGLTKPPPIAHAMWEGCWMPLLKTFRELGIDIPEIVIDGTMASDIGQIPRDGGDYLKFLLKVRSIVETYEAIEVREENLRTELLKKEWSGFCKNLPGKGAILGRFFPSFLSRIGLPVVITWVLEDAGLTTPKKLAAESDKTLLAIKGIGPAKLKFIRSACDSATDKDSELVDLVER